MKKDGICSLIFTGSYCNSAMYIILSPSAVHRSILVVLVLSLINALCLLSSYQHVATWTWSAHIL